MTDRDTLHGSRWEPCPKCRGTGDVHGVRCHRCEGSGDLPMPEIGDLAVLDGERQFDFPCVILDAEFARKAIAAGELPLFVHRALEAMELSGRRIAVLREEA